MLGHRVTRIVSTLVFIELAIFASLHPAHANQAQDSLEAILDNGMDDTTVSLKMHQLDLVLQDVLVHRFAQTQNVETRVASLFKYPPQTRLLIDENYERQLEAKLAWLKKRTVPELLEEANKGPQFDIPMRSHPLVDRYISYFSGRGKKFFSRWLARADRYAPIMQPILRKMGLPEDTIYLAMIESGFSAKAYSHASASGYWQFIASTGRRYNLRQDFWVDERRDFIYATTSAATYLRDLYKRFGDWHIAWAAYNAGEGRVGRALKRYNTNDYWTLISHEKSLAKETRHYVPKLIAAAWVAKNRQLYGFSNVKKLEPLAWDSLKVTDPTDLKVVAKALGVSVDSLTTLNPSWRQAISPPGRTTTMRVPKGLGEPAAKWLGTRAPKEKLNYTTHRVRSGDTLSEIARAYGARTQAIQAVNKIRNVRHLKLGQVLIIPTAGAKIKSSRPKTKKSTRAALSRIKNKVPKKPIPANLVVPPKQKAATVASYRVRSGDTFWSIARRHQISVTKLKKLNGRRNNHIRVGELLRVL